MAISDCTSPTVEFSDIWPDLSARLGRVLGSRRVPSDVIDDLVQETGMRLYRIWDRVDPSTVWALANTVALNLVRDEMRKQEIRQRESSELLDDRVSSFDDEVSARLELKRVQKVLRTLPRVDQQILLAEWGERCEVTFASPAAMKMARMRARRRLRAALEKASGFLPLWKLRRGMFNSGPLSSCSDQLSQLAVAFTFAAGITLSTLPWIPDAHQAAVGTSDLNAHQVVFEQRAVAMGDRSSDIRFVAGNTRSATVAIDRPVRNDSVGSSEELNENFGPIRQGDDGSLHVGEGGNGLGPYGVDEGYETSAGGKPASAHAKARYETPDCDDEVHIGGGETYHCDGPGDADGEAEAEAAGHRRKVKTP